ncbi:hypothetical protein CO614_00795 [Lysobacteraceae bacterium NML120232]|nr:hypothetical protein CO608_09385 [Xanthomonadaceae bacterium NML08-0793]PJK13589.1 hypothetical protein CO614_00795 [Xanthomonadaceae bacterium NML120232]
MQIRPLSPIQAWHWFFQAINLGMRNPRAVFGAAFLLVGSLYAMVMAGGLLASLFGGNQVNTPTLLITLLMVVAIFMMMPVLLGGLMHVIAEAEAGRPVTARDLFQPFVQRRAAKLAALGGLQILLMAGGMLITRQLAGEEYMAAYNEALNSLLQHPQDTPPTLPLPANPLLMFVWQISLNYLTAILMLLGIAQVSLSGSRVLPAIKAAAAAAVRNFLPNFLAAVLFFTAMMIGTMLLSLLLSAAVLLLGAIFMPLALLAAFLITQCFVAVLLVVVCGGGYLMWRDTFGMAPAQANATHGHIEL